MVGRLRLIVAVIWAVTLVLLAGAVLGLSNGTGTAGARPLTLQPLAADAATSRATDVPVTSPAAETTTTSSSTTVPPTTVAPTTVAPTTAPPTTARTTPPPPPATTPPTVTRPAVAAPPATAAPATPSAGGGSSSDYTLIGYKWNPCQVITITSTGPDVSAIVAELASITGLHLQVVSGPAAIAVSWGSVPAGGEIGETTWRAVGGLLSSGSIVISQLAQPYLATVLRHELGHSLGLGHASQPNEIMYPTAGPGSPTDYQAGDLAGLRAIGATAGRC